MRPSTPDYNFTQHAGPSSPPETPTNATFKFGGASQTNRRHGVQNFSRPMPKSHGDIQPVGQGPNFSYNPQVWLDELSPRSSTPSSESSCSPPRSLSSVPQSRSGSPKATPPIRSRIVTHSNFTISEMQDEGEMQMDSEDALSVIHADLYEDADSETAPSIKLFAAVTDFDARMLANDFENLDCNPDEKRDAWVRDQRARRRINRLSSGSLHKRTLSQSIGSDTDEEDLQHFDANDAGSSARRLRRKVGDRTSLIFDDPPQRIIECDEPESDAGIENSRVAVPDTSIDVEEILMHALPYYFDVDSMEVDSNVDE